jgi:hypothetical protein
LVLRLNQETIHDFILLFMPPCSPHLTPLATGSLERSLLVFSTPGGLTGDDLSRLFFTCTNTSQAATCTCNTLPRISPHNVVNHSSDKEATINRSSNHTWSSPWWNTEPTMQEGIQLPELLVRIKALRETGLRAEHVAFIFMKRRVQPLMARDTLGFEYTGDDDM